MGRHVLDVDTPHGPARVHLHAADEPAGALVLGHGAGGGVTARDLVAATKAARSAGVSVALVEQPYRVAGRRSPAPARQLDAAWIAVVEHLRGGPLRDLPLVVGGRSSGARVACRTAAQTGAVARAVPRLPGPSAGPSREDAPARARRRGRPDARGPGRLAIRSACRPPARSAQVVTVPGNHGLTGDLEALRGAVAASLAEVLGLPD